MVAVTATVRVTTVFIEHQLIAFVPKLRIPPFIAIIDEWDICGIRSNFGPQITSSCSRHKIGTSWLHRSWGPQNSDHEISPFLVYDWKYLGHVGCEFALNHHESS